MSFNCSLLPITNTTATIGDDQAYWPAAYIKNIYSNDKIFANIIAGHGDYTSVYEVVGPVIRERYDLNNVACSRQAFPYNYPRAAIYWSQANQGTGYQTWPSDTSSFLADV